MIEEDLDTRKVQFPRRGDITQSSTGVTTPKKHQMHLLLGGSATSRPSSPPTTPIHGTNEILNGTAVLQAALQKKMNRKRKVSGFCMFVCLGFVMVAPSS